RFSFTIELRVAEGMQQFCFVHALAFVIESPLKFFQSVRRRRDANRNERHEKAKRKTQCASRGPHDRYLFFSRAFFRTMLRCWACQTWSGFLSWSSSRNF